MYTLLLLVFFHTNTEQFLPYKVHMDFKMLDVSRVLKNYSKAKLCDKMQG